MAPPYTVKSLIPNISHTKSRNLNDSRLILELSLNNPFKPGVKNEDVVGAVPTGDVPTTSEIKFIAYKGATYIRCLTVIVYSS